MLNLPLRKKAIAIKWVLKVKLKADGSIERNKAWLVAKEYIQHKGMDNKETFSLVERFASIPPILVIGAYMDLEIC